MPSVPTPTRRSPRRPTRPIRGRARLPRRTRRASTFPALAVARRARMRHAFVGAEAGPADSRCPWTTCRGAARRAGRGRYSVQLPVRRTCQRSRRPRRGTGRQPCAPRAGAGHTEEAPRHYDCPCPRGLAERRPPAGAPGRPAASCPPPSPCTSGSRDPFPLLASASAVRRLGSPAQRPRFRGDPMTTTERSSTGLDANIAARSAISSACSAAPCSSPSRPTAGS